MTGPRDSGGVEDRYGLVFVLLLLSYVLQIFGSTLLGRSTAVGLYVVTLLIAVRAAGFSRRTARGLSAVMAVTTLLIYIKTNEE